MHRSTERPWLALLAAIVLLLAPLAGTRTALADEALTEQLSAAISAAGAGTVLTLPGGDYGSLSLRNLTFPQDQPLTIRSSDPARPATFSRLRLRDVQGVVLEGLLFDYTFAAGDDPQLRPFSLRDTVGITLRGNRFDGDVGANISPTADGYPVAFALSLEGADHTLIERNVISGFLRGVVVDHSDDLVIRGNDLSGLRSDGMDFSQVQRVLIEGNHIHDFTRSPLSEDHPDMIQFWTKDTTRATTDVTIRGNVLSSGTGMWTQTIFMRNESVDSYGGGADMYYRNVTIEGNFILNAHLHGISVGETNGLRIVNNTVLHNLRSDGADANPSLWRPQININRRARNVEISRNVTAGIDGYEQQSDWRVSDNVIAQDRSRLQPGFYAMLYGPEAMRDPSRPQSFVPLPGGPLDGTGIGAPMRASN